MKMVNTPMDFVNWFMKTRKQKGYSQAGLARRATDVYDNEMKASEINKIEKGNRNCSANHVIRIARAFRLEFLQALEMAGYISKDEVGLSKTFVPDNPNLYRIWGALKELSDGDLEMAEETVVKAIEAFKDKGGDALTKPLDTKAGHG